MDWSKFHVFIIGQRIHIHYRLVHILCIHYSLYIAQSSISWLLNNSFLFSYVQIDAMKSQQFRALIGQQQPISQSPGMTVVSSAMPASGRPIVKGTRYVDL